MHPLVSIGLAVYNGENYLRQALDCFLKQDYTRFELIISDNASTDKTPDICREYAAKDNRIKYYRNDKNIGAIANFNRVFYLSCGDYFMWASHDDYREPSYIDTCLSAFDKSDKIVLTGTACNCIDSSNNLMLIDKSLSTIGMNSVQRFRRYKHILHEYSTHRGGIFYGLFDRQALNRIMPMKPIMTTDQILMLSLCFIGEFDTDQRVLLTRRMNGPSNTSLKSLARIYGITNQFKINSVYFIREYEIDKLIINSDLGALQKAELMIWSLFHTFVAVGSRVISLGYRKIRK
jgi:glycosyltransferase involved in cell wall biosynthesis